MTLLSGQVSRNKIRQALEKLPDKLNDAYDTIMDRIGKQDEQRKMIATTVLMWITYAKERLNVEQLLHSILMNLEPEIEDIDADDLIDVELLLSSCLGLVVLNEEDGIVRLVHYTTQDYLEKIFPDAHTSIAKTSMAYLSFIVDLPIAWKEGKQYDASRRYSRWVFMDLTLQNLHEKYRLAAYAANYLGPHLSEGNEKALAKDVLNFLDSQVKGEVTTYFAYYLEEMALGSTELHFLARFGLPCVCRTYLIEHIPPDSLSATR